MQWTRIPQPPEMPWHSKPTAKTRAELVKRIEQLQTHRDGWDEAERQMTETPIEVVSSEGIFLADMPQSMFFDILKEELELRIDLQAYYEAEQKEGSTARSAAFARAEELQADVRQRLVGIGFIDAAATANVPGKITQAMIVGHPEVLAARLEASTSNDRADQVRENATAMKRIKEQMQKLRQRAAAAGV
ncbi:hypothetical protein [Thalassoroseus pseudoceratinae]|uniref:hypothetical protein n=1 Tax=Thalassoroseus pseudoceratinae TaxID=2713176 RepID=UPI001423988F|nr:hypothetical protein [Thalassoroseus pseudoceratinae]